MELRADKMCDELMMGSVMCTIVPIETTAEIL